MAATEDGHDAFRVYTPLAQQLETQPTFPLCEALFAAAALLALLHALAPLLRRGGGSAAPPYRRLVFLAICLLGGAANDVFFMCLPLVDNFWHAQGTLMLDARLPAYIPCVYLAFGYWPCAAAARFAARRPALPPSAQAAAAALAACVFYAAFDLVGQKFLWWTWHDTDAGVRARWLGVPVGSTLWTLVHTFVLARLSLALLGREEAAAPEAAAEGKTTAEATRRRTAATPAKPLTPLRALVSAVVLCTCTTPLMMVAMGLLQLHQLRLTRAPAPPAPGEAERLTVGGWTVVQQPGCPDWPTFGLAVTLAVALLVRGAARGAGGEGRRAFGSATAATVRTAADYAVALGIGAYYAVLVAIMALGRPEDVVSTGVHQQYGPCGVLAADLSGYTRERYLCAARFDEDFRFCPGVPLPADGATWYSLCGTAFGQRHWQYMAAVTTLAVVGTAYFAMLVLSRPAGEENVKAKRL